ncbi:MAG: diversity-generating retroelement protein Avd [Phycisphaerae bacterium]|nr:diversity-generating retroelement protein Avd [Phycisphaerae bacterium]
MIERTYDLVKWFLGHVAKFPRSHRYSLGQRIESRLYDVLEQLICAKYAQGGFKAGALEAVNLDLEVLRFLSRLAHEQALLPHKSHEYAARELNEIGRLVGGWLRQQRQASSGNG